MMIKRHRVTWQLNMDNPTWTGWTLSVIGMVGPTCRSS